MFKKQIPNLITIVRIICSACLVFIAPFSLPFFIIYSISGLSDVLDGVIARATNTTSELGSVLDSIADLIFYSVMIILIFPVLLKKLPLYIWLCAIIVVALRLLSYIVAAIKYHRFASLHTYLNKFTGLLVFLLPYVVTMPFLNGYCLAVCVVGGVASLEELITHIKEPEYTQVKNSKFKRQINDMHPKS